MNRTLDQFFTKPEIAAFCFKNATPIIAKITGVSLEELLFVEPSAGTGSFYDLLPVNRIGIDIAPRREEFIHNDFLMMCWPIHHPQKHTIAIGNPPFGRRGKLAVQFFQKAAKIADTIGFILPVIFRKYSVQKRLPPEWQLIRQLSLPRNSFYTDTLDHHEVNAEFQLWTRLPTALPNARQATPPNFASGLRATPIQQYS